MLVKKLTDALQGRVAEMPDGLGHDVIPRKLNVLHHHCHQRYHVQGRQGVHRHGPPSGWLLQHNIAPIDRWVY
jgi:hypothetical protein